MSHQGYLSGSSRVGESDEVTPCGTSPVRRRGSTGVGCLRRPPTSRGPSAQTRPTEERPDTRLTKLPVRGVGLIESPNYSTCVGPTTPWHSFLVKPISSITKPRAGNTGVLLGRVPSTGSGSLPSRPQRLDELSVVGRRVVGDVVSAKADPLRIRPSSLKSGRCTKVPGWNVGEPDTPTPG